MKITYIGHATLLIEVDGVKIVTDPWLKGAAYCEQWYLFPKPFDIEKCFDADFIFYSHGHEDHMHPESLKCINNKAHIFYPYSWYDGTNGFFNSLGFGNVTEAINEKTYKITKDISVTYFSNNLDNVVVIEHGGKVIVNVNDALHSAPYAIARNIVNKIKKRYPVIDYLFSSYGGAAYFPNCIKFKDKDDMEIGKARELFFLNNFCDFVKSLNPRYAIPFASDFVLLDDAQRWINETKFPRNKIKEYYKAHTNNSTPVEIVEFYPGDYIYNDTFFPYSTYHQKVKPEGLLHLVDEEYNKQIEEKRKANTISDNQAEVVFEALKEHVTKKQYVIPAEKRKEIRYAIQLTDYSDSLYYNIDLTGVRPKVYKTNEFEKHNIVLIKLKSATLLFSLKEEWGGDAIIIGYGCLMEIFDIKTIEKDLDNLCIRLITNYPNTKEYLKRVPFRAIKYLMSDSLKRNSLIGGFSPKKSKKIEFTDTRLGDHVLWLSRTKCEICKACNLPEM